MFRGFSLERASGIEPPSHPWQGCIITIIRRPLTIYTNILPDKYELVKKKTLNSGFFVFVFILIFFKELINLYIKLISYDFTQNLRLT